MPVLRRASARLLPFAIELLASRRVRMSTTRSHSLPVLAGRYRLLEEIARGGMAIVYRARDERLGRDVAIKMLPPERGRDAAFVERLQREARIVASLTHPHVVQVFDVGKDGDRPFLVLQLVDGPSLKEMLKQRGPLPVDLAVRIADQVADALAFAQSHGVVHGDVKSLNILLDGSVQAPGAAALTDFGVAYAEQAGADTPADVAYGSAPYVAPERLTANPGPPTPAADVYGLGVVLYEMLTGVQPFRGQTPANIAADRLQREPLPPTRLRPDIPQRLEVVVMRALARDLDRRYPDAASFRRSLLVPAGANAPAVATVRPPERPLRSPAPASAGSSPPRRSAGPRRLQGPSVRRPRAVPLTLLAAVPLAILAAAILVLASRSGTAAATQIVVPNLAGSSLTDARSAASQAGLQVRPTEQPTLDTPAGVVVTQDPLGGARVASGSTVDVVVSTGVQVPDLVGQQCSAARATVAPRGWSVHPVRWRIANVQDFGKVVQQDPAAGSVVADKGEITVQVAGPVRPC